jgi:hypothetical protein
MAKKDEAKNGLVENQAVEVVETAQPSQDVTLNEVAAQTETPGHTTRAFRG